jgi:uncharacterized membrane protein
VVKIVPDKGRDLLRKVGGDGARVAALVVLILVLVAVALVTVVRTSWDSLPGPELTIETCSFLVALLIVLAQQGAERRARRRRAVENLVRELASNASELTDGELMRTGPELMAAMADHGDGLRYYYSHLATTATRGAILSGALAGRQDHELVERLSRWVHECEACNRRFTMSELRLFSTAGDEVGVKERARIHVSIVTGPAAHQREALDEISRFLIGLREKGGLPNNLDPLLDQLGVAVSRFSLADEISTELQQDPIQRQLGFAG